jgi:Sporulation protein Cse60
LKENCHNILIEHITSLIEQMKSKVKIIEISGSAISLESQINQFLQKIDADNLIDIKLSSLEGIDVSSSFSNDRHIALIMYLE